MDGQLWVRNLGQPEYRSGQVVRVFGSIMDITELHSAYTGLEEANRDLETHVIRRTAELRNINEEMRREIQQRLQAEQALRESEARWRSYVENAPYGILIIDGKGNFQEFNPESCRLTGYSGTELL